MSETFHHKTSLIALLSLLLVSLCISQNNPTTKGTFLNIPYKKTDANPLLTSLDVYTPDSEGSFPVIVYVHGGAWEFGDKKYISRKPDYFVKNGFVFVSINHRLSPQVMHPEHVQDVADAIAWVYYHIREYGGDRDDIFLMGHSTGAHLVSLVSTDERYLKKSGLNLSIIRGTMSLDSDYFDIPFSLRQDEATRPLLEEVFGSDSSVWADASPVNHIERNKDIPPFLLVYVASREGVTGVQAERMRERLEVNSIHVEIFRAEDKTHSSLDNDIGGRYDEPTERIMNFIISILNLPPTTKLKNVCILWFGVIGKKVYKEERCGYAVFSCQKCTR
jgi:arylformamidase